jgi:3'(2'), 5'-bisphosphate nucleotidase
VTAADEAAQSVILEGLARALPGVPVIAEETADAADLGDIGEDFVLVDPLDGTRELMAGRDEFTVNLALVRAGAPVLGLIAAPALGLVWRTAAQGGSERLRLAPGAPAAAAAECAAIRTRRPNEGLIAAVSRSHLDPATEAFLMKLGAANRLVGGSAIKFCQVAEGRADVYPRLAPTSLWDVAAGHAVLSAAGGLVCTPEGLPLSFRPAIEGLRVPAFIAWGDPDAARGIGMSPFKAKE